MGELWGAVIAIKAGSIIDPAKGLQFDAHTIVIRDGIIESIVKHADVPHGVSVIDLSHSTLLPGLIDCHTHLVGDAGDLDPHMILSKSTAQVAYESLPNARKTLEAGFTTVRDVGTYRALTDLALRDAISRGHVKGPRMFVAGAYLTTSGGAGALTGLAPDVVLPQNLRFGIADGVNEVRKVVRTLANYGVDFIKILASGAVLTHGSRPTSEEFSFEELKAAVDEARRHGLKVAAHAHSAQGIKNAVLAGAVSIEHGSMLDDEGMTLMKEKGTFLVADIYNDDYISGNHGEMPKEFVQKEKSLGMIQRNNFAKAVKRGVRIAFGTDAGAFPHGDNAKQFGYMVDYGMTPMQAIQSATVWAAELLGKEDSLGSLAPGKIADIIATPENPLTNIKTLENVTFVMKEGVVYLHRTRKGQDPATKPVYQILSVEM
ncbi:MAG: amidohydrolase family protein [Deltaproteobacteria bacterium]|nr:amidohydrolase family protein [Deltaproteobacteria bacterium]